MIVKANTSEFQKISLIDILILLISLYVLSMLLIDTFFELPGELSKLINIIDFLICLIFLYDFGIRFAQASSKTEFLRWGWIDLIASIPTIDCLRYGRMIRVLRIIRIIRTFESFQHLSTYVFRKRTEAAFATVAMISLLMLISGSVAILQVEQELTSNIKTAEDALWWAFVTITSVGYGDKYPVTSEGRNVAAFLMVRGVSRFGSFTGYIASWFMGEKTGKSPIKVHGL